MSEIYCLKCKRKSPTKDEKVIITKNNRKAISGLCTVCNRKKNMFIRK